MPSLRGKITWRYSQKASMCNPRKEASGKTTLLTLRSLTSNLQSHEEPNFCCLSHSVCGISWWPLDRLISYVTANIFRFLSLSVCVCLSLIIYTCVCVKWSEVAQSCPTLCDPVDCSPPGSSIHRILQARILEWVSMGFSRQEYWSGLPFPFQGDLPNPGIEPRSPTLQGDALTSEHTFCT